MTALAFELACKNRLTGWLWDETYNPDYTVPLSLSVREMRFIADLLRASEGLPPGKTKPWTVQAEMTCFLLLESKAKR